MKKSTTRLLAGIAGFVVALAAAGVLIYKNPQLRREAKKQAEDFVGESRASFETIQEAVGKVQDMMGVLGNQKEQKLANKEGAALVAYNDDWDKHIWTRLSRPF